MNTEGLRAIRVLLPPLDLQGRFVEQVTRIRSIQSQAEVALKNA
ncbi:MAG: hypothetical protein ACRES4_03815 [Nevskiales bacterium]